MPEYPEHDKLKEISERSQALGEFIEFGPYTLCEWRESGTNGEPAFVWAEGEEEKHDREPNDRDFFAARADENPLYESWPSGYVSVMKPIPEILADWFKIDQDKLEEEKRQMLEEIRNAQ